MPVSEKEREEKSQTYSNQEREAQNLAMQNKANWTLQVYWSGKTCTWTYSLVDNANEHIKVLYINNINILQRFLLKVQYITVAMGKHTHGWQLQCFINYI